MVPSSTITADSEHLTRGGFSLGKTILLKGFKFIADYFDGLSLSPRRGDEGAVIIGSTRSEASTPQQAMIEDSAEEFLTTSGGEESFGLPSLESTARGHRSLSPCPHHGWRTLRPCRPR
jgi:hypothetical protein